MEKRRIITSYEKLSPELKRMLLQKYPDGYIDYVRKIDKPGGDYFYAFNLDTEDTNYLVKVHVKIDENLDDLEDDSNYEASEKDNEEASNMVEFDENESYDD
ncbi:MAG: hypothetical protein GVY19_10195 [Bacteroidetes bacterium]|jgi:transcription initiation factor IIE alpha subunit|nr:hypothetical protein [Bacteroidota bacterium]